MFLRTPLLIQRTRAWWNPGQNSAQVRPIGFLTELRSEWIFGQLSRVEPTPEDPTAGEWRVWKLPGARPQAYAVYVDDLDHVWVTDFGANALVRFDPETATFESFPHPRPDAAVRQLLGRPGEVWGALSGQDKLVAMRRQFVEPDA